MTESELLKNISQDSFVPEEEIKRIFACAPHTYKQYTIPKRSGGVRVIAQPAGETKFIQRWLIENLFEKLPVHSCAMAYKTGASIKKNAQAHVHNSYLVKFDFKDFFTSIKEKNLVEHFSIFLAGDLTPDDIKLAARASCIKLSQGDERCLSVGASSSPILSNSILYDFDSAVYNWCADKGIVYTRYADDLTFSTNEKGLSSSIEPQIREFVRSNCIVKLRFNLKKTTHLSKKSQRRVTGLVITNDQALSLGRERKREIKALIHQYSVGRLDDERLLTLQGLLGFAKDIEPVFLISMYKKYTFKLVNKILRSRKATEPVDKLQ